MMKIYIITGLILIFLFSRCGHSVNELTGDGIVTVGIYADEGASGVCYIAAENMFKWMGFETERIYASTLNDGNIDHIDIFYFPGGSSSSYDFYINDTGTQRLQDAIYSGRGYIGTCGGAYFATYGLGIFPGVMNGDGIPSMDIGMCQVYLNAHPVADNQPASLWIMYVGSPSFIPDSNAAVDVVGFYNLGGAAALVALQYGEGRVFLTGPHPEWEEDSDRDGVANYDVFDDVESDWPMMHDAARWCLYDLEEQDQ